MVRPIGMDENLTRTAGSLDEPWKERLLEQSAGAIAALLWIFTAVVIRPGIDFLLAFAVLLGGVSLFSLATMRWGGGKESSRVTLALCLLASTMLAWGSVDLAFLAEGAPRPLKLLLAMLLVVNAAYMRRVLMQEKAQEVA